MKNKLVIFLTFCYITLANAGQVDENMAKVIGKQFMINNAAVGHLKTVTDLKLAYTSYTFNPSSIPSQDQVMNFYIFNVNTNKGFVIVSGDDIITPILGYSNEGAFNPDKIPSDIAAWLKGYEYQIQCAISQNIHATPAIKAKWEFLLNSTHPSPFLKSSQGVSPLVQTLWSESPYYNEMCPYDEYRNSYTVTGCVATAMAQVMKYWNFPTMGSGFHSYNDLDYGTQSAIFASTTYRWSDMPMEVTSSNVAVATLMYHCGVSVDMNYGTENSYAWVISSQSPDTNCAEYALKTYFGYPSTLQGLARSNYNDNTWKNMLTTDLDANRPVIYSGYASFGGHCFICDGYDNNGFFHFNWGWGGKYDGYFVLDSLNPLGGNDGFNNDQVAIFGIQGNNGIGQTNHLQVNTATTISDSTIHYGNAFSVNVDIINTGTNTFIGDFSAAIFDNKSAFIGFVEVLPNLSLLPGDHFTNGLTFSNPGLSGMFPGTYSIYIFFRPTGGEWQIIANSNGYINGVNVTVINPNSIELYTAMHVKQGTKLTIGQPVSVHLDVINNGASTFIGTWDVSLYNLDGSFAMTIQQLQGYSLPSGDHYTNGLTFINDSLTVGPGTYLMALQYLPDSGIWTLAGSTNYRNPTEVLVQIVQLPADRYEPNNTIEEAYSLPVDFSNNEAWVTTPGANCNYGTDTDFYKINLPQGPSYSIHAAVDDRNYNGGTGNYTLDAIWTYSTDGTTWSSIIDDLDPNPIDMKDGGTIYFQVLPKSDSLIGTYMLNITVDRDPYGIEPIIEGDLIIYPNPTSDFIKIGTTPGTILLSKIILINSLGQELFNLSPTNNQKSIKIDVENFEDGLYFLKIYTSNSVVTKKVMLRK
jgi:hypothetical protein